MSDMAQVKQWDFDVWMNLARNHPERFEALRMEAIDELIESAPDERKLHLRRLQWRIDRVRERAATPMAATIAISKMMWDSFYDLRDHYQEMFGDEPTRRRMTSPAQSARIIPFRSPAHG